MAEIVAGERWVRVDTTAESQPGVPNGSPTWDTLRMQDGGIGLAENAQFLETLEHANSASQPSPELSHFAPGGAFNPIPSPWDTNTAFGSSSASAIRWLLLWFKTRTSGVLSSHTVQDVANGIVTREFLGCKPNTLSLGWSEGDTALQFGMELVARNTGRLTTALTTSDVSTFPSARHWRMAHLGVQIGSDLTVTSTDRRLTALQLQFSNNITPRGVCNYNPGTSRNETLRPGVMLLDEGELSGEGSFETVLTSDDWHDLLYAGQTLSFRIIGFHPSVSSVWSSSGSFSTTSDPTVTIAEDFAASDLSTSDYVYISDESAADPASWEREVLKIQTVTEAGGAGVNTIALDTNGSTDALSMGRTQAMAAGTKIRRLGLQFRVAQAAVTGVELVGGVREKQRIRVSFRCGIASGYDLFDFMVR